ncbi:DUF4142 domain-containing protein [Wenxinia marina]|uniref:Putative outer membrane protein n=1 Tax=Wenxinia marina DSM 24838 TaxID=1123501 RepID=A0A0D0PIL1_9RHOB|nr:DUF4142 domain-containing protein [Wenxinia marina]KIQ71186.1 putative outer membrane protein [Wenxinia marina DSM 24838]KIQ71220.1 putative outer membrane protein [Wenxinia marina DSM 24838]GGL81816.1 hypothetical protein GCM10011392_40530 [Wenxinia marina]
MTFRTTLLAATVAAGAMTAAFAQTDAAPVTDPAEFAAMAASSNSFEIESSNLALDASESEEVQAFAQRMIDDHTAAGEAMMAAAETDGVEVPEGLNEQHQEMLDGLQGLTGEEFDQAYLDAQVTAHDEAVALFEGFSTEGEDSALKAFAAETLPTLQEHQAMVADMAGMSDG